MYRCALAWTLVACGRFDFDAQLVRDGYVPSDLAGDSAAAIDYCTRPATVDDPLVLTGRTSRVTDFMGDTTPLYDVTVSALTPDLATVLATTTSSGSDGTWSLAVPTGGQPLDAVFQFGSAAQTLYTATMYPARPLAYDPHLVPNLFDDGSLGTVYGAASMALDGGDAIALTPASGTVVFLAQDCAGSAMGGVSFGLAPGPQALAYSNAAGGFQGSGSATVTPYANATALDEPPGTAAVMASAGTVHATSIFVGSGYNVTFVFVQPSAD